MQDISENERICGIGRFSESDSRQNEPLKSSSLGQFYFSKYEGKTTKNIQASQVNKLSCFNCNLERHISSAFRTPTRG